MTKPIKDVERAISHAANAAWFVYEKLNSISPNPSFTPKWSDKPLLKSWEKQKPKLGWPRETDALRTEGIGFARPAQLGFLFLPALQQRLVGPLRGERRVRVDRVRRDVKKPGRVGGCC